MSRELCYHPGKEKGGSAREDNPIVSEEIEKDAIKGHLICVMDCNICSTVVRAKTPCSQIYVRVEGVIEGVRAPAGWLVALCILLADVVVASVDMPAMAWELQTRCVIADGRSAVGMKVRQDWIVGTNQALREGSCDETPFATLVFPSSHFALEIYHENGPKTKSIFSVVREDGSVFAHNSQTYDGKDALN